MIKLIEYYLVAYLSVGFVIATWFTLTQYSFVKFVYKSKSNAFIVGVIIGGFIRKVKKSSQLRAYGGYGVYRGRRS